MGQSSHREQVGRRRDEPDRDRHRMTHLAVKQVDGAEGRASGGRTTGGRYRIAFVLFAGMVALQSSPTLDATKVAYLVGTFLCLLGAIAWAVRARQSSTVRLAVPWIASSAALVVLLAMSFVVARTEGTPPTDWLRDIAAYALFAAIPIFALDAEASTSRKVLVGMLVLAGVLGGMSWAVEWLSRRHIVDLPIARIVFPSGQLPGMLYLFAMATALRGGPRRAAWVGLAGAMLGLFLLTGTRSALLLLIGPLAMAALAGRAHIGSSIRSIAAHAAVAVALVVAFQLALALPVILGIGRTGHAGSSAAPGRSGEPSSSDPGATLGPSVVGDRYWSLPGLIGNATSDGSFVERVAQYRAAWLLFVSSPLVGVGPGHSIDWVDISGYPRSGFTADTPLVMPAKFGLLGILVFSGAAVSYALTARAALRRDRRSAITMTVIGYAAWTIITLPLGFPVEDKGASLALMLLLGLAFGQSASAAAISAGPSVEPNATLAKKKHPS
jgi:hypothetical protein